MGFYKYPMDSRYYNLFKEVKVRATKIRYPENKRGMEKIKSLLSQSRVLKYPVKSRIPTTWEIMQMAGVAKHHNKCQECGAQLKIKTSKRCPKCHYKFMMEQRRERT